MQHFKYHPAHLAQQTSLTKESLFAWQSRFMHTVVIWWIKRSNFVMCDSLDPFLDV